MKLVNKNLEKIIKIENQLEVILTLKGEIEKSEVNIYDFRNIYI